METYPMGVKAGRRQALIEAAIRGRVTTQQAAEALGLSRRQFLRLKRRFAREGLAALRHGNCGRRSRRRLRAKVRRRVEALVRSEEPKLNDCHVADLLAEEGIRVCAESVRRLRRTLGLPAKRRRRPPRHRQRRLREAREGEMALTDASPFAWLGPKGPVFTLVGAIDDASGKILGLTFRSQEDLHGYLEVFRQMFLAHGLPLRIYGDKRNILVRTDAHWSVEEELAGRRSPTHVGAVLERLGIAYVAANSPQAKGRIERLWGTLQDRLSAELRRAKIATLEGAEAFLPRYIERFNRRFARAARSEPAAWRKAPACLDLLLGCSYSRVVSRDNTVSIPGRTIQVPAGPRQRSWHGCRIEARELLDGRLLVLYGKQRIAEAPCPGHPFHLISRDSGNSPAPRRAAAAGSQVVPPKTPNRPAEHSRRRSSNPFPAQLGSQPGHSWNRSYKTIVARRAKNEG